MYIKQIIIQGFKSYKEQTVIEPFSPKTNVIVGRNGSGKSNFFAAIRFVLSDAYSQMGREERQALLHEGSGSAVMSAYVEIIFDNSDDRFPTGKEELILRRTIGLKKDEYSLDRKNATKTDVMNLLESAGFSRSNPYYIVPQGRVTALTNMKDPERLNLLKEVAGTQVYEARRTESLKIMTETNNKRAKIDELLDYIKERLAELEEEKEELRGYQEKDKDRRCLEYAFYHREQTALAQALDEIEEARQGGMEGSDEQRASFLAGEKLIQQLDAETKQLTRQMELLKLERRQLDEDRREASKTQAKVELKVKSLTDGQSAAEQARSRHQQELKAVKQDIASKEAELAKILPDFNNRKAKELEVRKNLDTAEAARTRLYNKQGRTSQFKNKAERDAWLKDEIQNLSTALGEQKANRIDASEEVKAVQTEIKSLEGEIAGLRKRFEGWGGSRQALYEEVTTAKDGLEKLQDERKVLRREDDKLESMIEDARQERNRAEKELSHTMDNATSRGLAAIRRLKQEHNVTGAYGTIAELLDVPEVYRLAAEQTAGNSLFHYVVDNEKTATFFADALYKQRAGRVTIIPMAELRTRPTKLPNASDAIPLLGKLKYEPKFEKAMSHVFGKTVICPSLPVAAQYARSHGCNAITTDGDTANRKGAMTGGYIDPRKSRLEAVRAVSKWLDEYESLKARSDEIRREVEQKDNEITSAIGDLHKLQQNLSRLDESFDPLKVELRTKSTQLEKLKGSLDAINSRKDVVDQLIRSHGESISAYELDLAADFKKALTSQEERQLEQLNTSVQELQQEWNELSKARRELEGRKQLLELDLRENLRLKLDQLSSQEIDTTASGGSGNLKEAQRELKRVQKAAYAVTSKLQDAETQIEQIEVKISNLAKEKAQQVEQQSETAKAIEKAQKRMEKSVAKKALLTSSAADCAKNIRDLGVLPDEAFEKYSDKDSKYITSKLKKVNDALKKYKGVNKKAFEQYNSFTSQRDSLTKRRKELDDGLTSIQDLVEVLDQRKDEAIERTFKQVSKEFASIFERLVPAGRGRLVIQRKTDQRARDEEDSDEEPRESVENYTGVGISVSFNSKHDEQQRIQQLSGGQKSKFLIPQSSLSQLINQVCVPSHWFSPSNNAIQHHSTSSMKSTQILMPNTEPPLHKCSKRSRLSRAAKMLTMALGV
ncbi:Structural maintenance of chromosomes protein 3, variant 2 [Cadophora gregata f. sp. sojae]|nr:Structural maintenance of chromosomes protein 3, variant 2 [Cadophora gregata f. sp. sojae]